jgi:hypothetical protein
MVSGKNDVIAIGLLVITFIGFEKNKGTVKK